MYENSPSHFNQCNGAPQKSVNLIMQSTNQLKVNQLQVAAHWQILTHTCQLISNKQLGDR